MSTASLGQMTLLNVRKSTTVREDSQRRESHSSALNVYLNELSRAKNGVFSLFRYKANREIVFEGSAIFSVFILS